MAQNLEEGDYLLQSDGISILSTLVLLYNKPIMLEACFLKTPEAPEYEAPKEQRKHNKRWRHTTYTCNEDIRIPYSTNRFKPNHFAAIQNETPHN